ncbi:hypothetical protein [Pannonibacter tanglangensis]|nr:hypothetical protein [Pannonibacter sp. XCT-53]
MLGGAAPEDVIQRTQEIVDIVPIIPDDVDKIYGTAAYQELSGIDGIDTGEHILAAIFINSPAGRMLLSGDKRFIQAFREYLPDRWDELSSSIISFETCILAIEERYGFEFVLQRVLPVKHCDGSLRIAIGDQPKVEHFRKAMTSYNPCGIIKKRS